jgi:hypothetical protein
MMASLFVRITVLVALALVALVALAFVLKLLFVAAVIAALVIVVLALTNRFRRRGASMMTLNSRRRTY